jgi:Zn-dependent protease/predicted transcriptional regulator
MQTPRQPWSVRIGSIAGIPIRIHLTFLLFLAMIAFSQPSSVVMVLCIFAVIVVHELGHALVARRFGIHTRQIMLLPIGGVASLERIPDKPAQELAVALVGPAINLAIAAVLAPFDSAFARSLMWINIGLALFNLLPAFPMDGGRVLRALLAMRLPRQRATEIAAALGKVIAIGLAVLGVFTNFWLVLIAIVVWMGARAEAQTTKMRAAIVDVPVSVAMHRQVDIVRPDEPLGEAARLLVSTGQMQLPIVDHGETVGVLTRTDVARGIEHAGPRAAIAEAPHHAAITVAPSASLGGVFDRLSHEPDSIAVVVDHGVPVGVVTSDQLATYVALRRAG